MTPMNGRTGKWKDLCWAASNEQDPERLLKLTERIIELLDDDKIRLIHSK